MVTKMQLIIGLGNPGSKYANTRHNIGFDIIDAIATRTQVQLTQDDGHRGKSSRWTSWLRKREALAMKGSGVLDGLPFNLIKPLTFMNRSGLAVVHYAQALQLDAKDILVMFDDISLPTGTVRLRKKGGAGGHNGVQSIIDELGTSDFPRLRFGVGNDFERGQQVEYVLAPFADDEREIVATAVAESADAILTSIREGIDIAMNQFNRRG